MAYNIVVPEINDRPKNTKDMVITLLTYEWPLSAKTIYNRTKKYYSKSFTYQSIYKSIKELVDKKVLLEKDKKYEINIGWIKKLQSFTDIVETNYFAKKETSQIAGLIDSGSSQNLNVLHFETIFDAEKYLYYFMKTEMFKKRNLKICYQVSHEWKPIFYLRAEFNYYTRLIERGHQVFFLSGGSSEIEQDIKKFYNKIGAKFKHKKSNQISETISFSDYLIQIFIPGETKVKIKKQLEKKDIMGLRKTLSEKTGIKMIINKDKDLAKETQEYITKNF